MSEAKAEKRPRGRPRLDEDEKMVGRNVWMPRALWEKIDRNGGVEWLRALVKRARDASR
jgi:hypothetical protein